MSIEETVPIGVSNRELTPWIYLVVLVPTLLGAAHHIDHIIRGNHVGWPVTAHVNPFTYSLAIYPLFAVRTAYAVWRRGGP